MTTDPCVYNMLKTIYYWLHKMTASPGERGEYSAGRWQDMVRSAALGLCAGEAGATLEAGCGEGLFLERLGRQDPAAGMVGVDNRDSILARARQRLPGTPLIQAGLADLPFRAGSFDTVVCVNVFFNLPSDDAVRRGIEEIARVCKPGGRFIFDIRNKANFLLALKYGLAKYYDATVKDLPLRTYSLSGVQSQLERARFRIARKMNIGFPHNGFAPIFLLEARKDAYDQ